MKKKKNNWTCPYNMKSNLDDYNREQIYPQHICPWLYHAAYPYMLGLLYGADFRYNKKGDANVICPAKNGCETLVRRRSYPGYIKDDKISPETTFVIYVEIMSVGKCPKGHKPGQKFLFPTCVKKEYLCPAAWNQAFPMLNEFLPECIDPTGIRCPDWGQFITIGVRTEPSGGTNV